MARKTETITVSSTAQLWEKSTRRDFMRLMGIGGAVVFLPGMLASCDSGGTPVDPGGPGGPATGPGTGATVTIDFAKGDIAVLQFAYALEQLEADFYTRVAAGFSGSGLSASEQATFADIKNHEVIHRDAFKTLLGASNGFTLTPVYNGVNFSNRDSILATAKAFEDLGVSAYNGAAQYIKDVNYLLLAGKIVSVEARHASAIADIISHGTTLFSLTPFDDAFSPQKVAGAAQGFITEKLAFAGTIPAFVQGPNNNG